MKRNYSTFKEIEKYNTVLTTYKIKCKRCNGKRIFFADTKKLICPQCGHYIFANDVEEFKYKLNTAMLRQKNING